MLASSVPHEALTLLNYHTDTGLSKALDCSRKPVEISDFISSPTLHDCRKLCMNEKVTLINVGPEEDVFYENEKLGINKSYCFLSKSAYVHCNPHTTRTIFSINSHICQSKFPNMFGGVSGDQVVACNDKLINDPRNILWDNEYNKAVSASNIEMYDEDQLMPDRKNFRFTCNYNGEDEMENKYIPHPINRFKPIRNWCASKVFRAAASIQTQFIGIDPNDPTSSLSDYKCDCGDRQITRSENSIPNDFHSQCIPFYVYTETPTTKKARKTFNYTYNCFTLNSPISFVTQYLPCNSDVFVSPPNSAPLQTQRLQLFYSENVTNAYIEHPKYEDFTSPESQNFINKVLFGVNIFK
ncbi:uncharacterized protein LOC128390506 [Panonychus citri]|uniref:uncharacterized protein LOC128390506 n=1 Tax=Panonychus citri TaxID=50023 RepID=UPI0023082D2A|nr:uncharacterized protein LOC128390506 [Panonychus citri]